MLVLLIKFAGIAICLWLLVLCIIGAVIRRKQKTVFAVYSALFIIFLVATYLLLKTDLTSAETTNREEAVGAFESNFGFNPPGSVKEIKLKNYSMYDASAHWMSFSYDSLVFKKILEHDQPLYTAVRGTQKFSELESSLREACKNCPRWFQLPNLNTDKIFYKKDFLPRSSSEYYLWVNSKERMVYLAVSYFD